MPVPTSATSDDDLWKAYDDGASYDITGDVEAAKSFIVACRLILRRRPRSVAGDGQSATFEDISSQLEQAEQWLALQQPSGMSGGPRHLDFRNLRV
jgi:hypothetical protein